MGRASPAPQIVQGTGRAKKGRPRILDESEIAEVQKLYWEECLPVRIIADALQVSHMTVWRAICNQLQTGAKKEE